MNPLQAISTWLDFNRKMPSIPGKQKELLLNFMKNELELKVNIFFSVAPQWRSSMWLAGK